MSNKQFEFLNSNYSISSDIKQIIEFIAGALPAYAPANTLLFKAKIIVTELLTNSLKHAGTNITTIGINIADHQLSILKIDFGNPLPLIVRDYSANIKIPITNDILHTLYAIIDTNKHVSFFCDENNMDDILAIEDIVEHFGLLIITKSADSFSYHYNDQIKENTFEVIIAF